MTEIVCTLTADAHRERLAEYGLLFAAAFVARERTPDGARWTLTADPGIAEWARTLAERENACCAFLTNTVTVVGERVLWDMTSIDDPVARAAVEEFSALPDRRYRNSGSA
jgi:hypothetical protein